MKLSLGQLQGLNYTSRSSEYSTRKRAATTRQHLDTVMSECQLLQQDLNASWRRAKINASCSVATLETAKRELTRPPEKTWKTDPTYVQNRFRIKGLSRLQSDRVEAETLNGETRQVKITFKTTQTSLNQKAREVQKQIILPVEMLDKFHMVRELGQHQRAFGEQGEREKPATVAKYRRVSTLDEMHQFWKAEINKYAESRTERLVVNSAATKSSRNLSLDSPQSLHITEAEKLFSPLQRYVLNYSKVKMTPEAFQTSRRMRMQAKMSMIQPSKEVMVLAQKYLPKPRLRPKRSIEDAEFSRKLTAPVQLHVPSRPPIWPQENPEDILFEEVQKEMHDTARLLQVETILSAKSRRGREQKF